jgi:hypothetical protein
VEGKHEEVLPHRILNPEPPDLGSGQLAKPGWQMCPRGQLCLLIKLYPAGSQQALGQKQEDQDQRQVYEKIGTAWVY